VRTSLALLALLCVFGAGLLLGWASAPESVPDCTEDEVLVREPFPHGPLTCLHIDEL
jgi:hypothetical protein